MLFVPFLFPLATLGALLAVRATRQDPAPPPTMQPLIGRPLGKLSAYEGRVTQVTGGYPHLYGYPEYSAMTYRRGQQGLGYGGGHRLGYPHPYGSPAVPGRTYSPTSRFSSPFLHVEGTASGPNPYASPGATAARSLFR